MPAKPRFSLAPSHVIEKVGEDVVVLIPESKEVLKLSGELANLVYTASISGSVEVPEGVDPSELVDRGIIVLDSYPTRRTFLKAGAVGAGASVVALGLPSVAAASSVIQLTGRWAYDRSGSGGLGLFQDFIVSRELLPSSGTPSDLNVLGGIAEFFDFVDPGDGTLGAIWGFPVDVIPDPFPATGENILGTFSWNGTNLTYSVTFVYDPDLNFG